MTHTENEAVDGDHANYEEYCLLQDVRKLRETDPEKVDWTMVKQAYRLLKDMVEVHDGTA